VRRTDPELRELHAKFVRGQATAAALQQVMDGGFTPDLVYSHPGWGESMFLRDVCPSARQVVFAEYYYGEQGGDTAFDPEFSTPSQQALMRSRVKNTHLLHALSMADDAISPDRIPAQPAPGVGTAAHPGHPRRHRHAALRARPAGRGARLRRAGLTLRPGQEVVTFVARQLEPYRGYHIFMRCLAQLQRLRPQAQVVIVGGDGVSYGAAPPEGKTWKQIFLDEVSAGIDLSRVHFVGRVQHEVLTQLMQVSAAHVYLTYPFVLSWSMLEAMSIGCLVIGSRTAPVQEVIDHGRNGLLTDFFDPDALARTIADALQRRRGAGAAAAAGARRHHRALRPAYALPAAAAGLPDRLNQPRPSSRSVLIASARSKRSTGLTCIRPRAVASSPRSQASQSAASSATTERLSCASSGSFGSGLCSRPSSGWPSQLMVIIE
jgi:glycosyltransferase involved in cell wall biosynthesis